MEMRLFSCRGAANIALMVLFLVLSTAGCAREAPPPPPVRTIAVLPAKVDQATLKAVLPAVAKGAGLPEAAVPTLPPCLGILAVPVKFTGSGWPVNELVSIELVVPPGLDMKGLAPGEDSVGIGFATADASGKFEVAMESTAKINWLLRSEWTPFMKPDLRKIDPLPNGIYNIRAVGLDPRMGATVSLELELLPPAATPAPTAEKPAPGKLSFEAAEYTNVDLGFSVKYPKDWKETPGQKAPIVFYGAAVAQVPVLVVSVVEAATFADALNAGLGAAGGTDLKIVSERETSLADGTKASKAVIKVTVKGFPAEGFAVGAKKDGKWVTVTVATVAMLVPYDEAKFSEIAHTLQFKK